MIIIIITITQCTWVNSDKFRAMGLQIERGAFLFFTARPLSALMDWQLPRTSRGYSGMRSSPSMCVPPDSSSQSTDALLWGGNTALETLFCALLRMGTNAKMTFWISAGNILRSHLNKVMAVPLIFLGWYSSEEWKGAAHTARTSQWWVRSRGSCYSVSLPELSCGQGSKEQPHQCSGRKDGPPASTSPTAPEHRQSLSLKEQHLLNECPRLPMECGLLTTGKPISSHAHFVPPFFQDSFFKKCIEHQ